MRRLKVSLLCLLSMSLAGSLVGQTARAQSDGAGVATYSSGGPETAGVATYDSYSGGATWGSGTYFNMRYMSGNGVGYDQGYFQIGGFVPFWMGDNAFIAPDVRLMIGNQSTVGGNLGAVSRFYKPGWDRTFGAAAYLDVDQSSNRNTFTQGTFGLETLGEYWDLRANAYFVPGTQDKFVSNGAPLCVTGDPFFQGNNIVFMGQQAVLREQAMDGVDIEFGMPLIRSAPWLRMYAGAYYYQANQVAPPPVNVPIPSTTDDNPVGFRARMDAWISDDLLVGVNVTTDPVWGTNVNGMVDFRFSGFKPTRYFPQWTTRERMLAPWQRNWRIAVEQYGTAQDTTVAAINPNTGKPYFVSFIDNSNPNPGNGSFENPFNSFDHPGGISGADIILVERGTSTEANPYLGQMKLFNNQILVGEGSTIAPLPLSAAFGDCVVSGNFALPGLDASGNYPFVSNPGGYAIKLADNNEVTGFNIVGGGGGISADVNNFNLHDMEIYNTAGIGIDLQNASGTTTIIKNINIGSANHANPLGIGNNTGGGILITTAAAGLPNLQMTNVFMNSSPAGTQPFGINLGAYNGDLTATLTNVHADGNVTGIVIAETGRTVNITASGVTANNNTSDGIQVLASGGTTTLNLNVTQLNGNGRDGLGLYGAAAATINDNIINSQLNGNGRDGIHKEFVGASTNNEFIDPTLIVGNGRDGIYYSLTGGSVMNEAVINNNFSGNNRSAFYGLMDNSTANFNIQNLVATGSGADGFSLVGVNNSTVTGTLTNVAFSNSGANGMAIAMDNSDGTLNMSGISSNVNVQNGLAFQSTGGSTLGLSLVSSALNGNFANGIVGNAQGASQANLIVGGGSSISGNTINGVSLLSNGLSSMNASFANTAINNNLTGNGVLMNIDNSPGSSLALTGTTSLIGNGANGLLVNASTNTVFNQTLSGTQITGNAADGIKMNVVGGSTVTGTAASVVATGNNGNGVDVFVSGAGSGAALAFTNLTASNNVQSNANIIVNQGGFLNFDVQTGTFSSSVNGNGIDAIVADANSAAYLDLDTVTIDNNANGSGINGLAIAAPPGVGQTDASLNVCLDNSSVSNNGLQGISVTAAGAGGTVAFGVGTLTPGSASNINNNGLEGVKGNAVAGGTINWRSIGSHYDGNGTAAPSDGVNLSGNQGVINTLFYGGSADFNSRNGVRLGPVEPNPSTNLSDLTLNVANGFSASNNTQYGLVLDGNGANSANYIQDPNTPPVVLTGNGAGPQNLNFAGANQVLLQLLGSFNGGGADGVNVSFSNITTAIVSINGLGNGTIDNNAGNGIHVTFNNVTNTAVTVSGYSSISNNGLNGVLIDMNGNAPNNKSKAAIEIQGIAGNTLMDGNGLNGVNINLLNTDLVDPFNQLPGVNLNVLTVTDNDPLNACIPVAVVLPAGGNGLIPTSALKIDSLTVQNTGASGGTGGITVAGQDATIVPNQGFITNNTVTNSQNGPGISFDLTETIAPTVPIASGMTISGNTVNGSQGNGIEFNITNAAAINVATADNLQITNNNVSVNNGNGIQVLISNPIGSVSTANGMNLSGNTVSQNAGNGILLDLASVDVTGMTISNTLIDNNGLGGLDILLDDVAMTNITSSNLTITDNNLNGMRILLDNASTFSNANFTGATIRNNGLDGVDVEAIDGTTSVFGSLGNSVVFASSNISDNGQAVVGADGVRLRLYGGSSGDVQFNSTYLGNSVAPTQQYGLDFILGSAAFPGGTLVTSFNNSTVAGNNVDGILGLVNGTGVAGVSSATVSLTNTDVFFNNWAGVDLAVNNAGSLGLIVSNTSLIDRNGSDGIHINATGPNTTTSTFLLDSTITNNGQTTPPGLGNGLTLNVDGGALGTLAATNMTIGNTAAGGSQQNGILINTNQGIIGSATNVIADISDSNFLNNAVSGIAGHITGNNVGLNPINGLTMTVDTVTVDGSGGSGVAFLVDNGALLRMSVADSTVTNNGQHGMYLDLSDAFTLAAVSLTDTALNSNGTLLFPGDGFNATVTSGSSLNVCAETTIGGIQPMSFSGNTGDGMDVNVTDAGSRADIDLHEVIAGVDAGNGLLGNLLNGVRTDVFDGGELNLRANTTHFDGNGGAGLLGTVNDTNGLNTVGRYRIIGGTADNNIGDGFSLLATNTTIIPIGVATLTAQFQADDGGTGISAQNNGGYGLNFVASNTTPPGGGIVGNLLMTGGSTLLGNGAGTLNVDMNGADQAIIGLSGTFNGSTTGDGIHIDLQNITGLALVSLQGPGEVRNNAGDGIDVSMTNVAQGGVFIAGFTDVSDNGFGNNALIGQDGIKVTMSNVGLGAVKIDSVTSLLPANIMNVSNNTGNGVNVTIDQGSVIDNVAFDGILAAQLVDVIDYTAPEQPCPDPLPNPLLTIVPTNVSTALGFSFLPGFAIQNLVLDNNGNATGGNTSGDGIVLTVDTLAQIVGTPLITNNTITNTGATSATTTHDGILVQILGNADVTSVDLVANDVQSNNGNGIVARANLAATLASLNISDNTVSNNFGGLGTSGNGIVLDLEDAAVLATITIDNNDIQNNTGDGVQMLNPATGVDLTVNFTHNDIIGNGSIVPPNAQTTYPAGGMGIDIVLNNVNAIRNTINVLSDATGVNTISNSASFGLFLQATNQSLYDLNVTGTGARNVFDSNVDAGIAVVGGSFVNPNNTLDPTKFSVGNVLIDNVNITNTAAGSHPALPNYPFSGDGIGILMQQYAQMNSFVIGSAAARNTTLANNAGDGLRINAIEQSQFRQTLADGVTAVTPLGQATILLQQIDATANGRNGIDIIRRDNALLSWDDATVNPGAALFSVFNPLSWQAITDGGSFIHINDVIATGNGTANVAGNNNGLNISTTNAQFPITRVDIIDTNPVAMTYNPKTVGHSVFDSNFGRGIDFDASADSILVVNAQDTSASDNNQGGIRVQTFNRATFGDVLVATPLGDPTSDNSIRSTFNGMLISGNGSGDAPGGLSGTAHGFEVIANGGADPFNVSSQSVVNISMTQSATNARNLFDSNGGDAFRILTQRFSASYFNLNRIDMRDTAFVQLGNDGLHITTTDASSAQVDLTNASIGYPTASSTQTGLSGDGIDATSNSSSFLALNVGNTLALNRFGDGIAPGAADPVNSPDVSIYGNRLNGIVIRNQGSSNFIGNVFDTASRFNGNRGYSAQMQDGTGLNAYFHQIDHSLFSDNSFEGIAVIANSRSQSGAAVDITSLFTTNPAFQQGYLLPNFLNYSSVLQAGFVLTDSRVENNGGATPYVNSSQNVNGLEIDVSTRSYVAADIRNNVFHGNTLDDVATASFQASTGGFNANGTISTTGLLNTPGSIDEVVAGVDRIFLEDTAQLDMRFMHNVGDQLSISNTNSNNPNMNANGAFRTDPNTKVNPANQSTAIFQVNAFHYDTVGAVTSDNVFTGTNIQPLDVASGNFVTDPANFPGSITLPGPVIGVRNLQAAFVDQDDFYTNPNAFPTNAFPTAFTQVRLDNITTGVNGTAANGVIGYTGATGEFTLAGAGSTGVTAGDVIRVHLLDTNTFNQFGVPQNVEGAFSAGFGPARLVRIPQGQAAGGAGTFFLTNPLAPYFVWPSASFPPN